MRWADPLWASDSLAQLQSPGKREPQLGNQICLRAMSMGAFSSLLIDEGGFSPPWVSSSLGKWAWAVEGST